LFADWRKGASSVAAETRTANDGAEGRAPTAATYCDWGLYFFMRTFVKFEISAIFLFTYDIDSIDWFRPNKFWMHQDIKIDYERELAEPETHLKTWMRLSFEVEGAFHF